MLQFCVGLLSALQFCGYGSLVVKVKDLWPVCYEFELLRTPTCKEGLNVTSVDVQTSCHWCGVEFRKGVILIICPWLKNTRSVAQSPYTAELCDVNIYSLIHSFMLANTQRKQVAHK
ncbi:hypothetical protein TNCV_4373291 [Trichonephila clavipes]|uniref:Secreted protein n=1 Tax=Trichonephila clavipes TaxID=2585209 RepID=A0A8X6R9A1_TRICX|nr:hypothetical protein TNCV_4373291 [Trichonephila clavipes]